MAAKKQSGKIRTKVNPPGLLTTGHRNSRAIRRSGIDPIINDCGHYWAYPPRTDRDNHGVFPEGSFQAGTPPGSDLISHRESGRGVGASGCGGATHADGHHHTIAGESIHALACIISRARIYCRQTALEPTVQIDGGRFSSSHRLKCSSMKRPHARGSLSERKRRPLGLGGSGVGDSGIAMKKSVTTDSYMYGNRCRCWTVVGVVVVVLSLTQALKS